MALQPEAVNKFRLVPAVFWRILRITIFGLAALSGAGIITMIAVTCLDVILRIFRCPLTGAYDIVQIAGTITIAAALPYTTAVKGHVAIEYFFHKLSRRSRIITDTFIRLVGMGLFSFVCRQSIIYAEEFRKNGQVTLTLQVPIYWIIYFVAFSFGLVALVILYHMLHPGQEMIKL
jgi:TRAP-type C4-dicarboxylate transport system permease small subunit